MDGNLDLRRPGSSDRMFPSDYTENSKSSEYSCVFRAFLMLINYLSVISGEPTMIKEIPIKKRKIALKTQSKGGFDIESSQ